MTPQEAVSELDALVPPIISPISIEYFINPDKKSVRLVNNHDEFDSIKSRNQWYPYEFDRLLYIEKIQIFALDYNDYNYAEISYISAFSGVERGYKVKFDGEKFEFIVNDFVGGFGIRPDSKYFGNPRFTSIKVFGAEPGVFSQSIQVVSNVNSAKQKIIDECNSRIEKAAKADQELIGLQENIKTQNVQIKNVEKEYDDVNQSLEAIKNEVKLEEEKLQKVTSIQKETINNNNSMKTEQNKILGENKILAEQISLKSSELRKLENTINLFPSEIAGYVKQGGENIRMYFLLLAVPIIIIIIMTYRLIVNAEGILDYYTKPQVVGIVEFLISRTPYVFVSFIILGVSYTFIHRLLSEIIAINRRRQDMYKISIIATDISLSSQNGLEISDEQSYRLRTETKIELLREHLRNHIGENYKYSGGKWPFNMIGDVITSGETHYKGSAEGSAETSKAESS